jgi:hypothetical protein
MVSLTWWALFSSCDIRAAFSERMMMMEKKEMIRTATRATATINF